jgi:non-heme chloroperoxidase
VSGKLVEGATLKVYPGVPHGMCSTNKDRINADLFESISGRQSAAA